MASLRASKNYARVQLSKLVLLDATHRLLEKRGLKPNQHFADLWELALQDAAKKLALNLDLKLKTKSTPGKLEVSGTWKSSASFLIVTDKMRAEAEASLPTLVSEDYFARLSEQPT